MLRKIIQLDWVAIVPVLLILGVGLLILYSFSIGDPEGGKIFLKQLIFALIGLILMFSLALTDYHYFISYSRIIYFGMLIGLILVLFFGTTLRGTSGWIGIAGLSAQPVELAKIGLVVFLASFISKKKSELSETTRLVASLILSTVVIFLVLRQPDFGSAMILAAIWLGMVLISGISKKNLIILILLGAILSGASWFFLADYQKARIQTLFDPQSDPQGSGYNVIQSVVAVGSGGLTGKGVGHGSQSQLNFLPEKHTDFIFAVVTEELGIAGAFFVLAMYAVLLIKLKKIATVAQDNFGFLLVSGVMVMLFVQIVINVGMNIGVIPVAGIPLPLLSYGGSSLVAFLISMGMVLNVSSKRDLLDSRSTQSY